MRSKCHPEPPIPARFVSFLCYCYGLRLFRKSAACERVCNLFAKVYYIALLLGIAHAIRIGVLIPNKIEECITLLILLFGSLCAYVFLRKNIRKIEKVWTALSVYLSQKDKNIIRKKDVFFGLLHTVVLSVSMIAGIVVIYMIRRWIQAEFVSFGWEKPSDFKTVFMGVAGFLYYMQVVYSIISCSIGVYTTTMIIFEVLCQNIKSLILRTLSDGITVEAISRIRTVLRIYWSWKGRADRLLNVFPFIWMVYFFLSTSLILTKVIADWNTSFKMPQAFLVISLFFTALIACSLVMKWHLLTAPDKTMEKCLHMVFSLTDPRTIKEKDSKLRQEIMSLHIEILNSPKTCSTILGSIRLSFETIVSYIGALVNFAVMVINIRMAVKI